MLHYGYYHFLLLCFSVNLSWKSLDRFFVRNFSAFLQGKHAIKTFYPWKNLEQNTFLFHWFLMRNDIIPSWYKLNIFFLIIFTIVTYLTNIGKFQFLVPSQLFDNIMKTYWRHQIFFVSNKFVPSFHNNNITIYKLIAQIYLIFAVGALK